MGRASRIMSISEGVKISWFMLSFVRISADEGDDTAHGDKLIRGVADTWSGWRAYLLLNQMSGVDAQAVS